MLDRAHHLHFNKPPRFAILFPCLAGPLSCWQRCAAAQARPHSNTVNNITMTALALFVLALFVLGSGVWGRSCYKPSQALRRGTIPASVVKTTQPPMAPGQLPENFDWRNAGAKAGASGGGNLCGHVLTQQQPHVCGSCWAEAAMGALSDRFVIATNGTLRLQVRICWSQGGNPLLPHPPLFHLVSALPSSPPPSVFLSIQKPIHCPGPSASAHKDQPSPQDLGKNTSLRHPYMY